MLYTSTNVIFLLFFELYKNGIILYILGNKYVQILPPSYPTFRYTSKRYS